MRSRRYLVDEVNGPLPGLLLLLTVTTGMVDAVTILRLGKVFTANMTGNTIFVGLALAHAPGFLLDASLIALLSFVVGAAAGGVLARRAPDRARLLRTTTSCQVVLVVATIVLTAFTASYRDVALTLLALSFGMQNAAVNGLKVPDETTSVVTRTITALVVDFRRAPRVETVRRLTSVVCILVGAVAGGLLVLHVGVPGTLSLVVLLQLAVIVIVHRAARAKAVWAVTTGG